jgi:single-strand DNA-binding protein
MSNINSVVLTGNLTSDPDLRELESGTKVCNMRIAVNGRRRTAEGAWVDTVDFFNIGVFGAQAENCDSYLSRGRPIAVQGRLDWRETGKDSERREYVKVIAEAVQFLGSKPGAGEAEGEEPEAEKAAQEELAAVA